VPLILRDVVVDHMVVVSFSNANPTLPVGIPNDRLRKSPPQECIKDVDRIDVVVLVRAEERQSRARAGRRARLALFFSPQAAVEGGILHRQMRTLSWPIWNLLQIRITRRWRPLLCTFTYIETKAALDTSILSVKATTRGPLTWSPRWPQPSLWWASPALSWHTWSGSPCGQ
jgi:hypothetical protein